MSYSLNPRVARGGHAACCESIESCRQNKTCCEKHLSVIHSPKVVTVNPQSADEFGEAVASKWAEYQRETSGRMAIQGVANLFADANVPLSEEKRRRLVDVYADAFGFLVEDRTDRQIALHIFQGAGFQSRVSHVRNVQPRNCGFLVHKSYSIGRSRTLYRAGCVAQA